MTDILPEWKQHGACVGKPVSVFFPKSSDEHASERAKRICADCDVRLTCLEYAIVNHEDYGVWGGLGWRERELIRIRRRRPIDHGTSAGYRMHQRRGEPQCAECLAANASMSRQNRAAG